MKTSSKFKKLTSVLLAAALICTAAVPVFAEENEETVDIDARMYELMVYNEKCAEKCGLSESYKDPGSIHLAYAKESSDNMKPIVTEVYELLHEYYDFYPSTVVVTEEMIDEKMEKLWLADEAMCVDRSELRLLLEFCGNEKNDGNYYSDEVWSDFQTCFENADKAISEKADDVTVDAAYWDLFLAYNRLCTSNQVYGDVNGDGVANVKDVTEMQLYIVEAKPFNSSQKLVALVKNNYDENIMHPIDVSDATALQMYIVEDYNDDKICCQLKHLTEKVDVKDWKANALYEQEKDKHAYDFYKYEE